VKFIKLSLLLAMFSSTAACAHDTSQESSTIRVATFNVSMEALNYLPYVKGKTPVVKGDELINALNSNHQQVRNIAEIIQRVNPDIILLNEFDRTSDDYQALKVFLNDYLAKSQNNQDPINYPYFYQGPVNTGVNSGLDINQNGIKGKLPEDGYGFGFYPGHFGMALLSKYPIDTQAIRTFQKFKWADMPNALKPIDPETNKPFYEDYTWNKLRLSSKSHWDIPVKIGKNTVHILASHPTPPVFDGKEDRNGKRNHDEIRLWTDYISKDNANYLYDDNKQKGGLKANARFVILGDLNASTKDGDAIVAGIASLINHPKVNDANPSSKGAELHSHKKAHGKHHTAYWGMRADYVLPSSFGFKVSGSGVFWPTENEETYRLIKDRKASSDHRLVWVDLTVTQN